MHSQDARIESARHRSYTPQALDGWPAWVERAERQIAAANLRDFLAAGVTADSSTDEAMALLLMHFGHDDEDIAADIAELLGTATRKRLRMVRQQLEAALDATADEGVDSAPIEAAASAAAFRVQ